MFAPSLECDKITLITDYDSTLHESHVKCQAYLEKQGQHGHENARIMT